MLLTEAVNCFGTKMKDSRIAVFYHGVSMVHFSQFIATFHCPTSTTPNLQVALNFAQEAGVILELQENHGFDFMISTTSSLRYFNCEFVSHFANEEEKLFMQPPHPLSSLQFRSIRNLSTDENYREIIGALTCFEKLCHSLKYQTYSQIKMSQESVKIMNSIIRLLSTNSSDDIPDYMQKVCIKWTHSNSFLLSEMAMHLVNIRLFGEGLDIWHHNNIKVLRFDVIANLFKKVKVLQCLCGLPIDGQSVQSIGDSIRKINLNGESLLQRISLNAFQIGAENQFVGSQEAIRKLGWTMCIDRAMKKIEFVRDQV